MRSLLDVVYPLDELNVSTCDTQKLVLDWKINQPIFDIGLQYLCVNPSGVGDCVSARTNHGVLGSINLAMDGCRRRGHRGRLIACESCMCALVNRNDSV